MVGAECATGRVCGAEAAAEVITAVPVPEIISIDVPLPLISLTSIRRPTMASAPKVSLAQVVFCGAVS